MSLIERALTGWGSGSKRHGWSLAEKAGTWRTQFAFLLQTNVTQTLTRKKLTNWRPAYGQNFTVSTTSQPLRPLAPGSLTCSRHFSPTSYASLSLVLAPKLQDKGRSRLGR